MGFFFRKSLNLGMLKINFSKNGIGYSLGVKGFRISKNSKGVQINAGSKGFYYRKQFSNKKIKEIQENGQTHEFSTEEVAEPKITKKKQITKSPEQEFFEAYLTLFTIGFIVSFVLLFIKFSIGWSLALTLFILRKIYIKRNKDKYEIYKENPEPQCYYFGHFPNQIKELQRLAEVNNEQ